MSWGQRLLRRVTLRLFPFRRVIFFVPDFGDDGLASDRARHGIVDSAITTAVTGPLQTGVVANPPVFRYSHRMTAASSTVRFRVAPRPVAGFSLIELLITLALLVVISTLYFGFSSPNYQRSARQNCQASLQKIFLAQEIYAQDHAGKYPVVADAKFSREPLALLVPRYTVDQTIFHCPGSQDAPLSADASLRTAKISYAYYQGRQRAGEPAGLMSDAQVNTNSKSLGEPVFSATGKPPGNNHHQFGGNILFTDGHVEMSQSNAAVALPLAPGVRLLNPGP